MKKKLAALQEEIEAVNRERKLVQEGHAPRLQALSRKWIEVMQKNVQIEVHPPPSLIIPCILDVCVPSLLPAGGVPTVDRRDREVLCCRGGVGLFPFVCCCPPQHQLYTYARQGRHIVVTRKAKRDGKGTT